MDYASSIIVLSGIGLLGVGTAAFFIYNFYIFPKKRKEFLIREMGHCLTTREDIYGTELIDHCRTILRNIAEHCTMRDAFKTSYTYGKFEIGVNWYPVNGQFEFTLLTKMEPIARLYYPT